jgi:hypothetical protein
MLQRISRAQAIKASREKKPGRETLVRLPARPFPLCP